MSGARLGPKEGRVYFAAVIPTSLVMACAEVYIVASIVSDGWSSVLPIGLGAGLGCTLSMLAHFQLTRRRPVGIERGGLAREGDEVSDQRQR